MRDPTVSMAVEDMALGVGTSKAVETTVAAKAATVYLFTQGGGGRREFNQSEG
jgi:hypothetical protein